MVDYDATSMPEGYDRARVYAADIMTGWMERIARLVPEGEVRDIIDLGCGTGRYTAALAERYGANVLAILQEDRRTLIRDVFGTYPMHQLPRERRTFNPYSNYRRHCAGGVAGPSLHVRR